MTTKKLQKVAEKIAEAQTLLMDTPNDRAHFLAGVLDDYLHDVADLRASLTGGKK